MAASSLLMLIDDIATILDDVAVMAKFAAKKTAGVLGDDLALNAQQVSGVTADRELPVVWAVAKGSALNKLILVPAALAIAALIPWAITPLLMLGGAYLCFEGVEKLAHKFLLNADESRIEHEARLKAIADASVDIVAFEQDKVKGAIRTDFVLSAEIIVIALGTVAAAPFSQQVTVLVLISSLMTIGVYGLVGCIVKIDDMGLFLSRRTGALARALGRGLLVFAPLLMKTLSVVGTAAMFMVGGSILVHGLPVVHHAIVAMSASLAAPNVLMQAIAGSALEALFGVLAGALVLAALFLVQRLRR